MVQIGEYILLKEGKESPVGKLLLAEHRILKRKAALKKLAFAVDPSSLKEMEGKIASLASVEHPNLARLQNVSFKESSCYFAYDWFSSTESPCQNLREYMEEKEELDEEELLQIAFQVASAIEKVHSSSALHLGVKASNVLVDTSHGMIISYLTDTGLSHLFPPKVFLLRILDECTKKSEFSSFWESFYALAPEQKEGHSSYKSDFYAFGVLMYKLLMGKFPEGRFPLPSESSKGFSYNWDNLIIQCLDPDPFKRPESLVGALKEIGSHAHDEHQASVKLKIKPQEIHRPQFEEDPGAIFHVEHAVVKYHPEEPEQKSINPIDTEMKIVDGGSFQRGSNTGSRDESPRHLIELSPFAIDVHPVTNEQFVRFLEVMGGEKDGNNSDMIHLKDSRIKRTGGQVSIESGYSKHPVVGVSWYGAAAYAKWVGKRLPTEAEWEAAACGGVETPIYPTGSVIERNQANFFSSDTTAVGSYPANALGLFDMAGNVYEWCQDWYDYQYYDMSVQEPNNPQGPVQGVYRVLRGGCWKSLKDDLRCAHRHRNNPGTMNRTYGFRCAVDAVVT
jgi:formylglycine-generating enzyme required for sulfatase activity